MTKQEIMELVACFDHSTAQTMKLTLKEFSLELTRGGAAASSGSGVTSDALTAPVPAGEFINAPLVGTFYAAAGPDQPPFVTMGDRVSKGQTVCMIEAMKMMSEITAPCDCVIEETMQENGALVPFDAPLFRYWKV